MIRLFGLMDNWWDLKKFEEIGFDLIGVIDFFFIFLIDIFVKLLIDHFRIRC